MSFVWRFRTSVCDIWRCVHSHSDLCIFIHFLFGCCINIHRQLHESASVLQKKYSGRKYASFEHFTHLLDSQRFVRFDVSERIQTVCERAHFASRNGLFRAPKWPLSAINKAYIASRNGLFRATTCFLPRRKVVRNVAKKTFRRVMMG